jgi:hypothetical protein
MVSGLNPRLGTHFVCVVLSLRNNLDDAILTATSPHDLDGCDPRGVPCEHGAIGILVRRQRFATRARPLSGLRGRKTLRGGSDVTSVNLPVLRLGMYRVRSTSIGPIPYIYPIYKDFPL